MCIGRTRGSYTMVLPLKCDTTQYGGRQHYGVSRLHYMLHRCMFNEHIMHIIKSNGIYLFNLTLLENTYT